MIAAFNLSGCGGSSNPASVAVTASATTVDATDAVTLNATVTNDKNSDGVSWTVSGGGTLSSQTTSSATYTAPSASSSALTVTVTATSVADTTKTATTTLTVPAAPTITTGALAAGTVGTAYSATLAASGGIAPYTWSLTSGTLPAGLSMNSAGVLSGTPTAAGVGTTNLTFKVTDSGTATALSATQVLGLTINAAPAIVMPASGTLATATYNVAYTGSVAATGGAGTLTYTLASGSLPTGLSLSAAGAIAGTPTAVGTFTFTIKAADAYGDSATQAYSIKAGYAALTVTTSSLPAGYVGTNYSQTLAAGGGSGTGYTWTLASGSNLPAGLSLSAAGVISGKPTATGTTSFTVTVTDSASNTANGTLSITVNAAVSITTGATLPVGYVGSSYSQTLAATGGSSTGYTWSLATGSNLPAGLNLSAAGVISGKPTTAGGPTSVGITVTDSASNTATVAMSITIDAGISFTPVPLPTGYQGTAYPATTLLATGGSGTGYAWSWAAASGSSLPAGLTLSTGGVISGTPTAAGTFSIVVTVTDSAQNTASATVSLTVEGTLTITTTSPMKSGTINTLYSQTLAASGGSGTGYAWATSGANNLAAFNLSLNSAGLVSGTPTTTGTAAFTAQVTDSQSHTATATLSITIYASLTVTTTSLPGADVGSAYSQTLGAAGGTGTGYTWTALSSNLSTYGLSLSTAGVVSGTPTTAGTASFTAQVTDSGGNTATAPLTITVYGALALPTPSSSIPGPGTTGESYTGTVNATGGSGNYTWSITGLPSDQLSATTSGGTLTISGTPGSATTVSFGVSVQDTTTGASVGPYTYSIVVSNPAPLTLPTPNPTSLPSATVSQSYTGFINASGGASPYTWSINGTAVPTNGTAFSLSDSLSATNTGGNTLSISGTPTTTGTVTLTNVKVTDHLGNTASNTYTIAVNSAGSQVSGQVNLNTSCGGGSPSVPTITVSINTSPVQTTTTDSGGNYSFASIPAGTYTITPSITGTGLVSMFYPATQSVTLSGSNVTENFSVSLGYTVSGTVTYTTGGTAQTGQTYLALNGNNCGGGELGTSITNATLTSGGAFTIRGVPPGSYTLQAWMDAIGQGLQNATDPSGSSSVTVASANVTNAAVTMTNPTFATPTENPTISGIIPNAQGVLIEFNPSTNSNGIEDANQYTVQWSTSQTLGGSGGAQFLNVAGSHTFTASGDIGVWLLNNAVLAGSGYTFSSGQTYYFQAWSFDTLDTANPHPSGWCNYTSSGCSGTTNFVGVTIGTPACTGTCTSVSSSVTIPASITINTGAPLYLGLLQFSNGSGGSPSAIYAMEIANPVNGANDFTVDVPGGSNYAVFGILDQNNSGGIGTGAVTNVRNNVTGNLTISGSTQAVPGITLPTANSLVQVQTQYTQSTSSSGSSTNYQLNLDVSELNKLPVAVTLTSGPNLIDPVDMSNYCQGCGTPQFQYPSTIPSGTPNVGDTYDFTVTYSDGSQDTGTTVNGAVTGWNGTSSVVGASDLATNLSPVGTSSTSLTPTFTWTYPANASSYVYSFYLCCYNNSNIWNIPSNNSKSNGFTSAQIPAASIPWSTTTDPTGASNPPTVTSLTNGTTYNWAIQVQDSNGNQATTQTWYQP